MTQKLKNQAEGFVDIKAEDSEEYQRKRSPEEQLWFEVLNCWLRDLRYHDKAEYIDQLNVEYSKRLRTWQDEARDLLKAENRGPIVAICNLLSMTDSQIEALFEVATAIVAKG